MPLNYCFFNAIALALEIIKAEKPDLVLLDVAMLEMSGFDVCNTVKNVLGIKDIYIMMLTGMKQEIDKQRGKDVGADYYMTKPFALDDLLERVVNVLRIEM
jgi:DNA-binding response OmpR family regulator